MTNARDLIATLGLEPHPEGGYFRETYRSPMEVETPRGKRSASTAIYFLIPSGGESAFHRVASDEAWHFYRGAPIRLVCLGSNLDASDLVSPDFVSPDLVSPEHRAKAASRTDIVLGNDLALGHVLQYVVPANTWFGAYIEESETDFSLVGCTVAPGFDFADFELARRDILVRDYPAHESIIRRLTSD